eukprot:3599231-Pleurochrysis_carterae.AAC.1
MPSILLNVVAFSVAVAIGVHQFWKNGEWDCAATRTIGVPYRSSVSSHCPHSVAQRVDESTEPRPPVRRKQVDRHQRSHAQLPTRTNSARRIALVVALLWSAPSCASSFHAVPNVPRSMKQPPTRGQRWLKPHRTSFSLAADLLEISACVAMIRGHLLSAAWDLARAGVFWALHMGHIVLPGRPVADTYHTYRTEAMLLDSLDPSTYESNLSRTNVTRSEGQPTIDRCTDTRPVTPIVSEPAPAESLDRRTRQHVDLRTTSNPRVLIATRADRHNDRHARGLRTHGKHI